MNFNLTNCQINLILQITSIFETSTPTFNYGICTTLADNHGYSAGIIQFTTGAGSAILVIQKYTESLLPNPTPFTPFNTTLELLYSKIKQSTANGGEQVVDGSLDGLGGFCDAWKSASTTHDFQKAQLQVLGDLYFAPALALGDTTANVKLSVSLGQIYDSVIQIGQSATMDLISSSSSRLSPESSESDEKEWIHTFLAARTDKLQSLGPVYAQTVTRIKSYSFILDNNKESDWVNGKINALNNDGNVVELICDRQFTMPSYSLQSVYPALNNPVLFSGAESKCDRNHYEFGYLLLAYFGWQTLFLLFFILLY